MRLVCTQSCNVDSTVAFQALNDSKGYTVFAHGSDQTADLSISGGVPSLQYSLTGSVGSNIGYLKLPASETQRYQKFYGPIPGYLQRPDNYTTTGVTGQLAIQPTPAARVTMTSSLFNSNQQRSSLEGAISQLDGEYIDSTLLAINPLIQNDVERATAGSLTSTNALTVNWQLKPEVPLIATGGFNTMQRTDQTYIPFGVNNCGPGAAVATCEDTLGYFGLGHGTSIERRR